MLKLPSIPSISFFEGSYWRCWMKNSRNLFQTFSKISDFVWSSMALRILPSHLSRLSQLGLRPSRLGGENLQDTARNDRENHDFPRRMCLKSSQWLGFWWWISHVWYLFLNLLCKSMCKWYGQQPLPWAFAGWSVNPGDLWAFPVRVLGYIAIV